MEINHCYDIEPLYAQPPIR